MSNVAIHEIGHHHVAIAGHNGVGPPTPYTLLLAESMPDLDGLTVVDIGTGSGILGIVASLQGAARVYVLDTNPAAIAAAMDNAERNGVRDCFVHLPIGDTMIPLPSGEKVDVVISNPAQLPLPGPEQANSPYYAGTDGRRMIEEVIRDTPARLSPQGRLLMVHNSVTDFPKSLALMKSVGLEPRTIAERSLELRPCSIETGSTSSVARRVVFTRSAMVRPTRRSMLWRLVSNSHRTRIADDRREGGFFLPRPNHLARHRTPCRPLGRRKPSIIVNGHVATFLDGKAHRVRWRLRTNP